MHAAVKFLRLWNLVQMNTIQKIIASFLVSTLLFVLTVVVAYSGAFKYIEVTFFQPRVEHSISAQMRKASSEFNEYYAEMNEVFAEYLVQDSVSTYISSMVSRQDLDLRQSLTGYLFVRVRGLEGIRLVESDGVNVHFSTFPGDVMREMDGITIYRNYDTINDVPWKYVEANSNGIITDSVERIKNSCHFYMDSVNNRMLFSYPLYDSYTAYRGTFIFYVSADDFTRHLLKNNILSVNDRSIIVGDRGFVLGMPFVGREAVISGVEGAWSREDLGPVKIVEGISAESTWFLITERNEKKDVLFGSVNTLTDLSISTDEKILLLIALAIVLFLLIFMALNVRHDDMVVIENRIRKFQFAMLRMYIERKDFDEWDDLSNEITKRKMDVNDELKKTLGRRGVKHSQQIDEMLDKAWRDIGGAFGGPAGREIVQHYYTPFPERPFEGQGMGARTYSSPAVPSQRESSRRFAYSVAASTMTNGSGSDYSPGAPRAEPIKVEDITPKEELAELLPAEDDTGHHAQKASEVSELESIFNLDAVPDHSRDTSAVPIGELEPVDDEPMSWTVTPNPKIASLAQENAMLPLEDESQGQDDGSFEMDPMDALVAFINRAQEELDAEMVGRPVEEITLEEYMSQNSIVRPEEESPEDEEEYNFTMYVPDFSALDPE